MKLKLKDIAGPTVDIGHGEYNRKFNRADQPFTVSEEESVVLLGTGLFEVAGVPRAAVDADQEKRKAPEKRTKE